MAWDEDYDWSLTLLAQATARNMMANGNRLELFGMDREKRAVEPWLDRAVFPHTLITGVPGLGKTHFARWIAQERKDPLTELMCPTTPASVETEGMVLLDEIHRQRRSEWLFPILESGANTIIGATTQPQALDPALASRFVLKVKLRRMAADDMLAMMSHLCPNAPERDLILLTGAAAGNPRQAHRLADTAHAIGNWEPGFARRVLETARINADGLTDTQIQYLLSLHRAGRPLGLGQLSILCYTDEQSLREDELWLIELDLISLTPSGRALTPSGERYVKALQGTL